MDTPDIGKFLDMGDYEEAPEGTQEWVVWAEARIAELEGLLVAGTVANRQHPVYALAIADVLALPRDSISVFRGNIGNREVIQVWDVEDLLTTEGKGDG